jgi:hypothetical protein
MWFNFKRFVEEFQVLLRYDKTSENQLSSRYYKLQPVSGKIILESKEEARRKGHPSPDRADAKVLAWCRYIFPLACLQENPAQSTAQNLKAGQYSDIASLEKSLRDHALKRGLREIKPPEGIVTQTDILRAVETAAGRGEQNDGNVFGTNPATLRKYRSYIGRSRYY